MARQVITTLIDDLDGKPADRTVEFGIDGVNHTIDLSEANAGKLRTALDPYIEAGRRLGRGGPASFMNRPASRSATAPNRRQENREIRDWAAQNGLEVSERGRIPQEVLDAYRTAHR
ncbi:Lsr2 family protein [Polymorphospora sp. NPDC050346]|uniref:histone-like nucleoid-structuring protein Lsr2 n=1 Tax=Polymorphospora sp. NPDC050346 TaxID=3155780 RepID=UPI0033CAA638